MLCCESSALRCAFVLNIEILCDDDTGGGSEFCFSGPYVRCYQPEILVMLREKRIRPSNFSWCFTFLFELSIFALNDGSLQLGDGSYNNRVTPFPVVGLSSGVVSVAAGRVRCFEVAV